ncbi:MAG: LacI family DNA-binding transcriptional regulator, partial [Clostridia bacterium]|nr:LacI family DNA-binding transcriptional regulator [Clostridia bacterium]
MVTNKRKTIGVFMNRADKDFQHVVQRVCRRRTKELGYDVFYFITVGYRDSVNYYDAQEKGMFSFVPVENLDGALVTPDSYDMPGFREALFEMLDKRPDLPVVCIRDSLSSHASFYTDENDAIRALITHLLDDHGYRRVCFQSGYEGHPD